MDGFELDDFGDREQDRGEDDQGLPANLPSVSQDTAETEFTSTGASLHSRVIKEAVNGYYAELEGRGYTSAAQFYDNFEMVEGQLRLKKYPTVSLYGKRGTALAPSSIAREINKVSTGGTLAVLHELGFDISRSSRMVNKAVPILAQGAEDVQSKPLNDVPRALETFHDSLKAVETQTGGYDETGEFTHRELVALYEGLATRREQFKLLASKMMTNENTAADKKEQLKKATGTERKMLERELKELKDEHDALESQANDLRGATVSQISNIKESLKKLLDGDKTVGERLKELFKEQGITIASILTALGLLIGVIVEALGGVVATAGGGAGGGGTGGGSWIKNQLKALGRLLSRLAGKAVDALPSIIGAIVSWLLNFLSKTASWLAEHVWALVVAAGGLLYVYITK